MSNVTSSKSGGKPEVTYLQRTLWILNTFYYQILATITIVLFWIFFSKTSQNGSHFSTHIILSTAAYVPLMAVAIILFSEDNVTTLYIPRTSRNWIHGILLFLSCIFVTIGIGIEIHDKSKSARSKHFKSHHAILGLVSWILVFVSVLIGCITANTRKFSSFVRPIIVKLLHNIFGLFAFILGVWSLWEERRAIKRIGSLSNSTQTGLECGLIFVTIWSCLAALKSLFYQIKGVLNL